MLLRLIALIALISLSGCGALYKLDVQQGNLFDKDQVDMLKPGSCDPDWFVVRRFEALCRFLAEHRERNGDVG